jgi:hypothetical protein
VGSKRLKLFTLFRLVALFGIVGGPALALGCGGANPSRAVVATPAAGSRHVQVVHAMTTPERRALVERLRARNPGATWTVNEDALASTLMVVDPFAGFVRRARRELPLSPALGPPFIAFRYVVDADTGDVVEDARARVVQAAPMLIPAL